jgi:hypothetical protein
MNLLSFILDLFLHSKDQNLSLFQKKLAPQMCIDARKVFEMAPLFYNNGQVGTPYLKNH